MMPRFLSPRANEASCWNSRVMSYVADALGLRCVGALEGALLRGRSSGAEGRARQVGVGVLSLLGVSDSRMLEGWPPGKSHQG